MAIEKPINEIISSIDNGEYTIPEFQRGFVWNRTQVKEFFRSLYLGYPTGSFLIWKTKDPSKIRGDKPDTDSVFHHLILDGQQRLTTIYTILKGSTPKWYEGVSLRTDLYFNLDTKEFEYYMPLKMKGKKEWIHVSDFFSQGGVNSFIKKLLNFEPEEKDYYYSKLQELNDLDEIKKYGYYIKEILFTDIEKVVEVFNLVNKSGTTLNESDLALAIITTNWPEVKESFRTTIEQYQKHNYNFSFQFLTRCLNMLTTNKGKYTSEITSVTKEELEIAWSRINKILPQVINVLRDRAFIDSSDNYSSFYVLYVLLYYLANNGDKFESPEETDKSIYWLFMALLWGRFSGSSESYLEKDLNIIKNGGSFDDLINEMRLHRGSNLYLRPEDLAMQGVRSRVFNIFYCTIRSQNAMDWSNPVMPLYSKNIGYNNHLQRHHIFPKAYLYKKYNSGNAIHKAIINEISNIAFVTQHANIQILDRPPKEYMTGIEQEQLRKQYVPLDIDLYELDNYESFLEERGKLLCSGINKFLKSYYEKEDGHDIPEDLEIFNQQIDEIEIALRDFISEKLENASEETDTYKEFVPQHIQVNAEERVTKWMNKNSGEDSLQFDFLRRKLDFFDVREYNELIVSKICWPLFEKYFGSKGVLENRFNQFAELRNCIKHNRDLTQSTLLDGEASITWFNPILRPYFRKESEELSFF